MGFTPPRSAIADISRTPSCVVTTSTPHGLTTGQVVRLHVPKTYGMVELNNLLVSVTVLSGTSFSIQSSQVPPAVLIDSTNFTPFVIPTVSRFTAEVLPAGSGPTPILDPQSYLTNNTCISEVLDAITNITE
jgi:hypothetical protein